MLYHTFLLCTLVGVLANTFVMTDGAHIENKTNTLKSAKQDLHSHDKNNSNKVRNVGENDSEEEAHRRFLSWFKRLFNSSSTTTDSTTTVDNSTTKDDSIESKVQEIIDTQTYLAEVLTNLTEVLERLGKRMETQNNIVPFRVVPLATSRRRYQPHYGYNARLPRKKRSLPVNSGNETKAVNATESITSLSTASPKEVTITTSIPTSTKSIIHCKNITRSVRRQESNNEIKAKLLKYLNSTFEEIHKKIEPVTTIKKAYSNSNIYKIGYIIANIDTLEINIDYLKKDMYLHEAEWDDTKVLELFDKIMASNKVVTRLIETLNDKKFKDH